MSQLFYYFGIAISLSMPITTLENIYEEFKNLFGGKYDLHPTIVIDFFEGYIDFINEITSFDSENELHCYILLIHQYVSALCNQGHYNVALDCIDHAIPLIDSEIGRLEALTVKHDAIITSYFVKDGLISN